MTRREWLVYQYIAQYIEQQGYSPLQGEIADAVGIWQQTVAGILQSLQEQGYLHYPANSSRMIHLTHKQPDPSQIPFVAKTRGQTGAAYGQRSKEVYDYIAAYIQQQQYPPALREIAHDLEMGTTTVKYHVDVLRDLGYLKRQAGKSRALQLTEQRMEG